MGSKEMLDRKQSILHLYRIFGIISFITGVGCLLLGLFNFGILPPFYEAQSGDPSFDASYTLLINGLLWIGFCVLIMIMGYLFYYNGKDQDKTGINIKFFLIAAILGIGLMIYLLLLLMSVVNPIQFYPHVLFAGIETPMDLSIVFNALLFYLLLTIVLRVSVKFMKYGLKLGAIK
jgi:hypothetical protein